MLYTIFWSRPRLKVLLVNIFSAKFDFDRNSWFLGEGGSGYSAEVLIAVKGSFNLLLLQRAGVVGKTWDPKVLSTMYVVLAAVLCHLSYNYSFLPVTEPDIKGLRPLNLTATLTLKIGSFFSMWFLPMNSFSLRFKVKDTLKSSMVQNMRGQEIWLLRTTHSNNVM